MLGSNDRMSNNYINGKSIIPLANISNGQWYSKNTKVPKFRELEAEVDVKAYSCAFEAHMDIYSICQTHWNKHLANTDVTEVYTAMEYDDQKCYGTLKEAIFSLQH